MRCRTVCVRIASGVRPGTPTAERSPSKGGSWEFDSPAGSAIAIHTHGDPGLRRWYGLTLADVASYLGKPPQQTTP